MTEKIEHPTLLRVVGFGPFPMPGEKRRWRRAEAHARRLLEIARQADQRPECPDG